jgi:hypothetical protein
MSQFVSFVERILREAKEFDKPGDYQYEVPIPLREINGVPVDCFITIDLDDCTADIDIYYKYYGTCTKKWQESMFKMKLQSEEGTFITEEGTINFREEFCEKVKKVTTLKFDHFNATFTFDEIQDMTFMKEMFECANVKLDFDECVVCYKLTKSITNCDHSLCLECWGKLPASCNQCKTGRTCPACRNTRVELCEVICEECN